MTVYWAILPACWNPRGDQRCDPEADTTAWEREIDRLVYELYSLTEAEIQIVEGSRQR
jgi:hypothetical protein